MEGVLRRSDLQRPSAERRAGERRGAAVPGRLIWRDGSGAIRVMNVVTRDLSESGLLADSLGGEQIPLYRLAYFQVARDARWREDLPPALRQSQVLAVVYRVETRQSTAGTSYAYALRFLIEPAEEVERLPLRESFQGQLAASAY